MAGTLGQDEFRRLLDQAWGIDHDEPDYVRRHRLVSAAEIDTIPPVEWLIPKHVAANELTVPYGAGGSYKSFITQHEGFHFASLGQTVIYGAAEGLSGLRGRQLGWRLYNDLEDDQLSTLHYYPRPLMVDDMRSVGEFIKAMQYQLDARPVLNIIDTVARNFGGNESAPVDMARFVYGCEWIRNDLGGAVKPIHHTTKDGTSERGTEALRNASFAMFKYTKQIPTNPLSALDIKCERMKDAMPPQKITLTPKIIELPGAYGFEPGATTLVFDWPGAALNAQVLTPDDSLRGDVRNWLRDNPGEHTQTAVEDGVGGKATRVREAAEAEGGDPDSPVQMRSGPRRSILYSYSSAGSD